MATARVLLVDDDDSVLSGLGQVLDAYDFDVTTARTVTEALKLIAGSAFDVLLTDLHMPGAGDGLIVAGAMRYANPQALTVVLSASPDMAKATAAVLRKVDEVLLKPVRVAPLVEMIERRLAVAAPLTLERQGAEVRAAERQAAAELTSHPPPVELVGILFEHQRAAITEAWLKKMRETTGEAENRLGAAELAAHLPEALSEIVYRLQCPQPLGLMTLFSMVSLQHGARRRRQGFRSRVLVEEARALQVALFQMIENNLDRLDRSRLPATLMAIADEVNAQLLQSLSGYENEKPGEFSAG